MIKVLLADDHDLVRAGLRRLLEEAEDIQVIAEASNGKEALAEAKKTCPDVAILDITMPVMDGLDACKQISLLCPDVRILILTIHPEEHFAIRLLKAGALGYITKKVSSDELHEAVRSVAKGDIFISNFNKNNILKQLLCLKGYSDLLEALSDRELQVFYLLAQGNKIKEIAKVLGLSIKTIDNYRSRALNKLNLKRTVELVSFAHQHKLV